MKTAVIQKTVVDDVLSKVEQYKEIGGLHLPKDYSVQNAIQAAGLIIAKTEDKNKKPALEVCTRESVANALLYMVTNGLNPLKSQCYFIVYGDKLECARSYQGSIALAKRFGKVKEVSAQAVFEDDNFTFEVDVETGRKRILEHGQTLQSIDVKKVKGAYAVAFLEDGTKDVEVMTIDQIKSAWAMRKGNGTTKAHDNFSDEMAVKSVINRLCKKYINSTDDSVVLPDDYAQQQKKVESNQNSKVLAATVVETKQLPENKEVHQSEVDETNEQPPQGGSGVQENKPSF